MNPAFTLFENDVMQTLLKSHGNRYTIYRDQFMQAGLLSRDLTGVGFFTRFKLPESAAPHPDRESPTISGPHAVISGLQYGAGFVLFVKDGFISTLEGYSYEEPWPEFITEYHFE